MNTIDTAHHAGSATTPSRAPISAWVLTVLVGLGVAAALGWAASLFYDENPLFAFAIFAAVLAPTCVALAWVVFVSKHTATEEPHAEESVEARWYQKATSGAFHDLILVCGLGTAALSIARIELPAHNVLLGLLLLAVASVVVRYWALKRREG